jgi:hypothetical protein
LTTSKHSSSLPKSSARKPTGSTPSSMKSLYDDWMGDPAPVGTNPGPGHGDRDTPPDPSCPRGDLNWPPNAGALGPSRRVTLPKGTVIDRYGSDWGDYTSPDGIPFEQRAMPPSGKSSPYSRFRLNEDIEVDEATIAPWFGEPGMGVQYKLPAPVKDLLTPDASGYSKITRL